MKTFSFNFEGKENWLAAWDITALNCAGKSGITVPLIFFIL